MECKNTAAYRYTWPGKDESYICEDHAGQLMNLANVMGLYLQFLPLPENTEINCKQIIED